MIEVFRAKPLADEYQCVWYNREDKPLFDMLVTGERVGDGWRKPQLIFADESQIHNDVPDFPALEYYFLIASPRAWNAIRPLVDSSVEALPVIYPTGEDYHALNVTRIVDCLLVDQCKTNRLAEDPTGYFSAVHRYAFSEDKVRGEHLFRCPQMKAFEIYVSSAFKEIVTTHHLTGLKFNTIYPPASSDK